MKKVKMIYKEFEHLLELSGLSKKEFSTIVDMNYTSITNWSKSNKVPIWVKSWLENYIKAKSYEDIKNKIFEIEKL
ncbi:XRE family transcriptional regulator [Aliarcobacter skirrowii]|nr:XRE family transcriptional regulator [Aliarcobacter skirrowii]